MLILSQTTITFSDFPVNIWVVLFMVYAFHGQCFFNQQYAYCYVSKNTELQENAHAPFHTEMTERVTLFFIR